MSCSGKYEHHARLERRKRLLELIKQRRAVDGDDGIGTAIERQILSRELEDLEREQKRVPTTKTEEDADVRCYLPRC